jgi:hypothetical protein
MMSPEQMVIEIWIDKSAPRMWHLRLIERLAENPSMHVVVKWVTTAGSPPPCVALLFTLEQLINGLPGGGLASPITPSLFLPYTTEYADGADLVLDLGGATRSAVTARW